MWLPVPRTAVQLPPSPPAHLKRGVAIKRLDRKLLKLDVDRLCQAIDPSADLDFDYLGIQTLYDRYLVVDKTGETPRRLETPQFFWMRVAMGVFAHDENPEEQITALYNLYKSRRFCSSTPTLFNSGTPHSQLSSCYLYKVDDTIESIMYRGIAENAFLSKWAGGLGEAGQLSAELVATLRVPMARVRE